MGSSRYQQQAGFSLIELVLCITLLGILMAGAVAMLVNLAPKTVDPAMEVRAAQLAQRLLNDISLQKYDQANTSQACGETEDQPTCTPQLEYGPDTTDNELALADFNDVDDYDTQAICAKGLTSCQDDWIAACWFTEQCNDNSNAYGQFMVKINVKPYEFEQDILDAAKQINISIRQPNGSEWEYAVLRGNYP